MPTPILRGYRFNIKLGRYIRADTGRMVSRIHILDLLEGSVDQRGRRLQAGLQAFADERISPSTFLARSKTLLKRQYLQNSALGAGGWDRMGPREFGRVGANLRWRMVEMRQMAQDLADGKISLAQATNRMNMYLGNARKEFFTAEREHMPPPAEGTQVIERRLLAPVRNCPSCIRYADMGWRPEGTLPVPGDACECGGNCKCVLERRIIPLSSPMPGAVTEGFAEGGPGSGHHGHLGRKGHIGGSVPGAVGSGSLGAAISKQEGDEAFWGSDTEEEVVFDLAGNEVFRKRGGKSSVTFTRDELVKMRDTVGIHNHPTGSGLSPADVYLTAMVNGAELRVIGNYAADGKRYRYVLTRPKGGWPSADEMRQQMELYTKQTEASFWKQIEAGAMSIAEANTEHWHVVTQLAADKFGLSYRREEV